MRIVNNKRRKRYVRCLLSPCLNRRFSEDDLLDELLKVIAPGDDGDSHGNPKKDESNPVKEISPEYEKKYGDNLKDGLVLSQGTG